MISNKKKQEIVDAMTREAASLGSWNKVASKLQVSAAAVSNGFRKAKNWDSVSAQAWTNAASILGVSLMDKGWNVVATTNMKTMHAVFADCQLERMFMAISEKAGSGKTTAIEEYAASNSSVYTLQCEEWGKKGFLSRLARELGITAGRYDSPEFIGDQVVRFFKQQASTGVATLLILDEADKLKPSAIRYIIPLYNKLEDELGLVVVGTDNLEKEIKRGVRMSVKGYDEIDSRLGRSFVHLPGILKNDVVAICEANGVNGSTIESIWSSCHPARLLHGTKYIEVVSDYRLLKRKIKAALLSVRKAA